MTEQTTVQQAQPPANETAEANSISDGQQQFEKGHQEVAQTISISIDDCSDSPMSGQEPPAEDFH